MVANIARKYDASLLFQGPVDAYFLITAPASSLTPTADANNLTLDTSGQPTSATGFHAGLLEGPASIQITEKCNEIHADQIESPIDVGFDSIEAEIDLTMKETTLTRLQTALTSANLGAYTALANSQILQLGGQFDASVTLTSILLVSPQRGSASKYLYGLFYTCFLASAIAAGFQRSKETIWKLKFKAVADLTRVAGDQIGQIVFQQ